MILPTLTSDFQFYPSSSFSGPILLLEPPLVTIVRTAPMLHAFSVQEGMLQLGLLLKYSLKYGCFFNIQTFEAESAGEPHIENVHL